MPVYQLLGGKCREAAASYTSIGGSEIAEIVDNARKAMAQGYRHIRLQIGVPGMSGYGAGSGPASVPKVQALHNDPVYEPGPYIRRTLKMLEECRKQLGDEIELLHDIHERVSPRQAVQSPRISSRSSSLFSKTRFPRKTSSYFRQIRQQCSTPLAMGELFNSPHEWTPLIAERLIDYIRIHISQAGGLTPCRKIALLAEQFGVKTAWHGPGDVWPVGHMCNLHLDLASHNFGVQEGGVPGAWKRRFSKEARYSRTGISTPMILRVGASRWTRSWQPNTPSRSDGARGALNGGWGVIRRLDGTVIKQ